MLGKWELEPWIGEEIQGVRVGVLCPPPLPFVGLLNGKVGCGQFGQASWIFFSFASVAVFPLVFLFIVLCGGSIEGQVSTRENSLATYIAFPLLSTPGMVFGDSVDLYSV